MWALLLSRIWEYGSVRPAEVLKRLPCCSGHPLLRAETLRKVLFFSLKSDIKIDTKVVT